MVLQQVKALKPDVVLFECKRSDGGGLRLCQKVMQLDDKPEVIVFSSFIDDDEWLAARSLGVRRYVLKEIASPALIGEIRAAHAARHQASYQH